MIYRFKCKAAGDVLMTGPAGDELMRIIGIKPGAEGIIESAVMPAAIRAIEAAVVQDEATGEPAPMAPKLDAAAPEPAEAVSLRQRSWPLLEMMKRAKAEGQAIVWGV
jgi:hypothetical protein